MAEHDFTQRTIINGLEPVTSVSARDKAPSAPVDVETSIDHAIAAVNAADLGVCIIDELETFLRTIEALADVGDLNHDAMRKQLATIRGLARLAVRFAADRGESYGSDRDDLTEALAALRGAA